MAPNTTPYQEDMPMQITLSSVRYTYPGATEPILNNVNVTFPQGWSGPSGPGSWWSGSGSPLWPGVPYTYRMYRRAGLLEMELPALNTLTQAGGKLPEALHLEFADWAARTGRRFFVMYGQTEAAPRMGYLPAERAVEKCGSMGVPVPGGQFRLLGEDGVPIDAPDTVGELVYRGPNVAMGYARRAEELALGDEWHGELHTGDMARRDGDGFYYIVGRKKRFIKLYGNRVGLDEVERLLAARFPDTGFACVGRDDLLRIFHDSADPAVTGAAAEYLSEQMHFPERVFQIRALEAIPKNEAGKTQYRALEEMR